MIERIRAAFAAGVDWVQIREKQMSARELAGLVQRAANLPEKGRAKLLVNERFDVALTCGSDGVHLPADSVPIEALLVAAPAEFMIGKSCHSAGEVEAAMLAGASFAVLGPIFETPGKGAPIGLDPLREACRRVPAHLPVLALGGITLENARACLEAGAAGIAAIRLFQEGDLCQVVSAIASRRA